MHTNQAMSSMRNPKITLAVETAGAFGCSDMVASASAGKGFAATCKLPKRTAFLEPSAPAFTSSGKTGVEMSSDSNSSFGEHLRRITCLEIVKTNTVHDCSQNILEAGS